MEIAQGIKALALKQNVLAQKQESEKRDKILSWISPSSRAARQSECSSLVRREQETRFLETDEFKHWLSEKKQILLCTGIPGAFKTVLAKHHFHK